MKLTEREIELIDGMIQVYLRHAGYCEFMSNSQSPVKKQKALDLEIISLLEKIKAEALGGLAKQ